MMAERLEFVATPNGVPVHPPEATLARKLKLAQTLETKVEQGFRIESQSETGAVLTMRGRRRWFGLAHAAGARYELTIDPRGHANSRRL